MQNDVDLEYKPTEMEGLFQMNHSALELKKLLIDLASKKENMEK
jgi:hypothetical protein